MSLSAGCPCFPRKLGRVEEKASGAYDSDQTIKLCASVGTGVVGLVAAIWMGPLVACAALLSGLYATAKGQDLIWSYQHSDKLPVINKLIAAANEGVLPRKLRWAVGKPISVNYNTPDLVNAGIKARYYGRALLQGFMGFAFLVAIPIWVAPIQVLLLLTSLATFTAAGLNAAKPYLAGATVSARQNSYDDVMYRRKPEPEENQAPLQWLRTRLTKKISRDGRDVDNAKVENQIDSMIDAERTAIAAKSKSTPSTTPKAALITNAHSQLSRVREANLNDPANSSIDLTGRGSAHDLRGRSSESPDRGDFGGL